MERSLYTINPLQCREPLNIVLRYDVARAARNLLSEILSFDVVQQYTLAPELCFSINFIHITPEIPKEAEEAD
jgi:hypothetical protein